MAQRKVVQIACSKKRLYALCNDGSLWCCGVLQAWWEMETPPGADDGPKDSLLRRTIKRRTSPK